MAINNEDFIVRALVLWLLLTMLLTITSRELLAEMENKYERCRHKKPVAHSHLHTYDHVRGQMNRKKNESRRSIIWYAWKKKYSRFCVYYAWNVIQCDLPPFLCASCSLLRPLADMKKWGKKRRMAQSAAWKRWKASGMEKGEGEGGGGEVVKAECFSDNGIQWNNLEYESAFIHSILQVYSECVLIPVSGSADRRRTRRRWKDRAHKRATRDILCIMYVSNVYLKLQCRRTYM